MKKMIFTALIAAISLATPALADPDWQAVGKALGKEGTVQPDGIYRVDCPAQTSKSCWTVSRSNRRWRSAPGSPFSPWATRRQW